MSTIRARSCIKCKEYVLIRPNDHRNLFIIDDFDKNHSSHTIITVNLDEIKDDYKKYEIFEA